MDTKLDVYIFFAGNCREAMNYYKDIFGGKLDLSTYGESPADAQADANMAADSKDKIMHAMLEGGIRLMGADAVMPGKLGTGKINVSLSGSDEDKLKGWFERLAEGGKVTMPLAKQFWGDHFGMVTDKYDVEWMVNINAKK